MTLHKAIQSGKEHREPYRHSKAFDRSCRNHGGCSWCEGNRTHTSALRERRAQEMEREAMNDNLPPGVTPGMIPSNSSDDVSWDEAYQRADDLASEHGMTATEFRAAVEIGVPLIVAKREMFAEHRAILRDLIETWDEHGGPDCNIVAKAVVRIRKLEHEGRL